MASYLAKIIYRPPRLTYTESRLKKLYPHSADFEIFPVKIPNENNLNIVGTFYQANSPAPGKPCVIYLHGNASNQTEGNWLVPNFSPYGVSVLCIDTTGCGNSDGEYITLGYNERIDVKACIEYLKKNYKCGSFSIWGRSMGAAIATWCAADNFELSSIVADSPYLSLKDIIKDLVGNSYILWMLAKMITPFINKSLLKTIGLSMDQIDIRKNLGKAKTPALFIHAEHDNFIKVRETRSLFSLYGAKKKYLMTTDGNHNSTRSFYVNVASFYFILSNFDIDTFEDVELSQKPKESSSYHYEDAFEMIKND